MTMKRNDKCSCNSGKKNKNCCYRNKNVVQAYVSPPTESQRRFRACLKKLYSGIKEEHCEICGDTTELINTELQDKSKFVICSDCYTIQTGKTFIP